MFLLGLLVTPVLAFEMQDNEFCQCTSQFDELFMKGDSLCHFLPNDGNFPNAGSSDTTKMHWKTITGNGSVSFTPGEVFDDVTTGYVTLACLGSGTAGIELSHPVMVSLSTSSPYKAYAWDQQGPVIHFRGDPDCQSKVAGRFQLEFFDSANREIHPMVAFDYSTCTIPVGLAWDTTTQTAVPKDHAWAKIAWQFTPPHASWNKISRIRLLYIVPPGVTGPTGIQIRKLYLQTMWVRPYKWPANAIGN